MGPPDDILAALGPIAMASRLKRLAERMQADAAVLLERAGLSILPGQVGALAALERYGTMQLGALAACLGATQPAVTRTVSTLRGLGLVSVGTTGQDARTRAVALTPKGKDAIARTRLLVWPLLAPAVAALWDGREGQFLTVLSQVEARMADKSMLQRVKDDLKILPWAPERAGAFHAINAAWIEELFTLEPHDKDVLEDPHGHIINRGGDILFASSSELGIVGACALMPVEDGGLELTKMGVLASARGRKVGEFLLAAVIARAFDMPQRPLFLLTSTKCAAAIHLYEKLGFQHDADIMARYGATYGRCDVAMRFVGL